MPSLIEQIQRDAVNDSVKTSALLRRVKLAVVKLGLGKMDSWVSNELNGYRSKVPTYRHVRGMPMAFNPFNGWIPIMGKGLEGLYGRDIGQPISALEDLLLRPTSADDVLQVPFTPAMILHLNQMMGVKFGKMSLHVDRGSLVSILDAVRNLVLDWSLEMENSGVIGTDTSFTLEEKDIARQVTMNIGSIGSVVGNVGSGNTTGDISVGSVDIRQVADIASQVNQRIPDLIAEGVSEKELKNVVGRLRKESAKTTPDHSIVRGALMDLRSTISGAGGGLISAGVLALIGKLLGV